MDAWGHSAGSTASGHIDAHKPHSQASSCCPDTRGAQRAEFWSEGISTPQHRGAPPQRRDETWGRLVTPDWYEHKMIDWTIVTVKLKHNSCLCGWWSVMSYILSEDEIRPISYLGQCLQHSCTWLSEDETMKMTTVEKISKGGQLWQKVDQAGGEWCCRAKRLDLDPALLHDGVGGLTWASVPKSRLALGARGKKKWLAAERRSKSSDVGVNMKTECRRCARAQHDIERARMGGGKGKSKGGRSRGSQRSQWGSKKRWEGSAGMDLQVDGLKE